MMWGCGQPILVLTMHDVTQRFVPEKHPINSNHDVSQCAKSHEHFLCSEPQGMRRCLAHAIDTPHTAIREPHRSIATHLTMRSILIRDFCRYEIPHPRAVESESQRQRRRIHNFGLDDVPANAPTQEHEPDGPKPTDELAKLQPARRVKIQSNAKPWESGLWGPDIQLLFGTNLISTLGPDMKRSRASIWRSRHICYHAVAWMYTF
jgi:hypothetical protein